jgi:hypothetical protein
MPPAFTYASLLLAGFISLWQPKTYDNTPDGINSGSLTFSDISFPYRHGVSMHYSGYSISYNFVESTGMEPALPVTKRTTYTIENAAAGGKILKFIVTEVRGNSDEEKINSWLVLNETGMSFWDEKRKMPARKQVPAISFPLTRGKEWSSGNNGLNFKCLSLDSIIAGPMGLLKTFCIETTWTSTSDENGFVQNRFIDCYEHSKGKVYAEFISRYNSKGRIFTLLEERIFLDSISTSP